MKCTISNFETTKISFELQMQSTATVGTASERTPLGYYNDNAFCVQSITGSNWVLSNPYTGQQETDSTMTISCS